MSGDCHLGAGLLRQVHDLKAPRLELPRRRESRARRSTVPVPRSGRMSDVETFTSSPIRSDWSQSRHVWTMFGAAMRGGRRRVWLHPPRYSRHFHKPWVETSPARGTRRSHPCCRPGHLSDIRLAGGALGSAYQANARREPIRSGQVPDSPGCRLPGAGLSGSRTRARSGAGWTLRGQRAVGDTAVALRAGRSVSVARFQLAYTARTACFLRTR